MLEPARADPICTLFVFLHLLECQAEGIPEPLLANPQHHPARAHPTAHIFVENPLWGPVI